MKKIFLILISLSLLSVLINASEERERKIHRHLHEEIGFPKEIASIIMEYQKEIQPIGHLKYNEQLTKLRAAIDERNQWLVNEYIRQGIPENIRGRALTYAKVALAKAKKAGDKVEQEKLEQIIKLVESLHAKGSFDIATAYIAPESEDPKIREEENLYLYADAGPGTGHPGMWHPAPVHPGIGHPGTGHPATGHPGTGHPG